MIITLIITSLINWCYKCHTKDLNSLVLQRSYYEKRYY